MPYHHPYSIALYDTDAAGVIFSANIIRVCHHAWEEMMAHAGRDIGALFRERTINLPVVHIEADFKKPLTVGMRVDIEAHISDIGASSFRTEYRVLAANGEPYATAAIVQVCVNPRTFETMDLPADYRQILETLR
jgi:1,4-dihydroxy-2-naphthoyl-CoA hydrolase